MTLSRPASTVDCDAIGCPRERERGRSAGRFGRVDDVVGNGAGLPAGAGARATGRGVRSARRLRRSLGSGPRRRPGECGRRAPRRRGDVRRVGGGHRHGHDSPRPLQGLCLVPVRDLGGGRQPRHPRHSGGTLRNCPRGAGCASVSATRRHLRRPRPLPPVPLRVRQRGPPAGSLS